jgi:hypothetical protein
LLLLSLARIAYASSDPFLRYSRALKLLLKFKQFPRHFSAQNDTVALVDLDRDFLRVFRNEKESEKKNKKKKEDYKNTKVLRLL